MQRNHKSCIPMKGVRTSENQEHVRNKFVLDPLYADAREFWSKQNVARLIMPGFHLTMDELPQCL